MLSWLRVLYHEQFLILTISLMIHVLFFFFDFNFYEDLKEQPFDASQAFVDSAPFDDDEIEENFETPELIDMPDDFD
jgi:hypothetical protein